MVFENKSCHPLILLNVGRIEMNANWNFPHLCSPFLRIYYVEEGEATITLNNKVYSLTPEHLYLIPPFAQHNDHCDGLFVHYYIHIMDQTIQGKNIYEQNIFPFEVTATKDDLKLIKRLCELNPNSFLRHSSPASYDHRQGIVEAMHQFTHQDPRIQYEAQAILMLLVSRFYNAATPIIESNDNRLLRVQQYIQRNLSKPLPLDELALHATLCKDSLIRLFRRELGITPVEYILNKRIEKAQMILILQPISIKEIAVRLGFGNQSYFASQFKRITGMTPLQYRKQNQNA